MTSSMYPGGGGGGSLGKGGNGAYLISGTGQVQATNGVRGGGGGGAGTLNATNGDYDTAGDGGDGYCKIELILTA